MVKAVTLEYWSIKQQFIREICTIFISYVTQSPDFGKNSDEGICDFRITGQSRIKQNCHKTALVCVWGVGGVGGGT